MKKMTSLERCIAVLDGKIPDRIPVVPQAFLFASKTLGYDIGQINRNSKLLAKSHIVCQEKYGYDGCVIDVDDATLAEACGAKVIYRDNNVACVDENEPILKNLRDIENLKMPDPYVDGRLPQWLEITKILKEEIGDHVFIMGRADQGPFSLVCLLRGMQNFMMDLITEDKEVIWNALNWSSKVCERFALAQIQCGANATSMGDSSAGPSLISPNMYREFALEHETRIVSEIQKHGVPYSIHICGDAQKIVGDIVTTGAKILELDWKVDMKLAKGIVGDKAVIMGNINPSDPLFSGTSQQVDKEAKKIIEQTKGRGLFLSSGCAIGANTKPENFIAMVKAATKYGTYEKIMELNDLKIKKSFT
ncbi:uroporphyrinogen decarboxylase family protein [Clostridium estertheticum]|uniref:uroporphyrinogen decarboxylase family protein n=1 Tax=Clostridium estertheticum TaxID=238834 RepID=UPI0013E9211F|nr:uroporphyrinogen decarboxylase family protein [Clostridium estertheticum]MBZ9685978.1 uroporphyrinogen decarboxylase family protein [Clostridium estertheticum]